MLAECTGLKSCKLYFFYGLIPARDALYKISGVTNVKIVIMPSADWESADGPDAGLEPWHAGTIRFRNELDAIQEAMMRPRGEPGKSFHLPPKKSLSRDSQREGSRHFLSRLFVSCLIS